MLNDIIIDKLRIAFNINKNRHVFGDLDKDLTELKKRLIATFSVCLPKDAYRVYKRYDYFHTEFNPAKFLGINTRNDTNLQMIPEKILERLVDAMPFYENLKDLNVVELNLTKNYALKNNTSEYINMLSNIKPANQKHPIKFKRDDGQSVYFSALKRDNSEKEYTGKKLIKFYDKISELKYKKDKAISHVKLREQLSEEEIDFFASKYNRFRRSIDLSDVNLLRLELTYRESKNLKDLAALLNGIKSNSLSIKSLTAHLKNGTLYSNLDDFFKSELRKNIFYNAPAIQVNSDDNSKSYNAVLSSLLLGNNINVQSEMSYLKNILETANMGTSINKKLKKVSQGLSDYSLYIELYEEIFNKESRKVQDIEYKLYPLNIKALAEEKVGDIEDIELEEEFEDEDIDTFVEDLFDDDL